MSELHHPPLLLLKRKSRRLVAAGLDKACADAVLCRVIHVEFDRMRRHFITHDFLHLQSIIGVDLVVIHRTRRRRSGTCDPCPGFPALRASYRKTVRDLFQFLRRQNRTILVHGLARMDLVLDAVKAAISMAAKPSTGSVPDREANFHTLGLRTRAERNTAEKPNGCVAE